MSEVQARTSLNLSAVGATDVGRTRAKNEDAFLIAPLRTELVESDVTCPIDVSKCPVLLAVADGVGGHNAGEIASRLTLEALETGLRASLERHEFSEALRLGVDASHEEVKRSATDHRKGMGSTLVAALIAGDAAYVSHVGDSRLYVFREDRLEQITKDHTLYQHAVDNGATLLDEANARNILLQCVGQQRALDFDVLNVPLRQGDLLLLCSDGLSGSVPGSEIAQELTGATRLDVTAEALVGLANWHSGCDNVTVVLGRLNSREQ
jgi:protein phosphatase